MPRWRRSPSSAPSGATTLLDWTYTTDKIGNILEIADTGGTTGGNRTYAYQDNHYFLASGTGPWGALSWTYDKIGNRISETRDSSTTNYGYPASPAGGRNPKLTSVGLGTPEETRFFFDAAGNETYKADPTGKSWLSYDALSTMSQVRTDSTGAAAARAALFRARSERTRRRALGKLASACQLVLLLAGCGSGFSYAPEGWTARGAGEWSLSHPAAEFRAERLQVSKDDLQVSARLEVWSRSECELVVNGATLTSLGVDHPGMRLRWGSRTGRIAASGSGRVTVLWDLGKPASEALGRALTIRWNLTCAEDNFDVVFQAVRIGGMRQPAGASNES